MGRGPGLQRGVHVTAQQRGDGVRESRRGRPAAPSTPGPGATLSAASLLRLQRSAGNAAVAALLSGHPSQSPVTRALQRQAQPTGALVHPRSRLTAAQLAKMVAANRNTPDWVKKGLGSTGSSLVKKGPLQGPAKVILDISQSLRDAVTSGAWEITTGTTTLTVSVTKPLSRGPSTRRSWSRSHDNAMYEFLQWRQVVTPDLEPGEHLVRTLGKIGPDTTTTTPVAIHSEDPEVMYGDTELADTTSQIAQTPAGRRRGLVVLVTEINVVAPDGTTKTFKPTDDQIVESLLHELSAHAGQDAEHRPSEHGRGDVNLIADEIAGWFPASSTTGDIYDFIQHGADAELAKVIRGAIHDFPF
jgi:hypothetical protein